jgi:serine/threonine protein kinase
MSTTVRSDKQPVLPDHETRVVTPGQMPVPSGPEFPFLRPPMAPGELGRLGGYRVFKLLGSGGMGKVFRAEDLALKREVALKVMCLPPGEDVLCWRERFLREARALAAIKHQNLVTVYQAGDDRGTVYLAMELLEGETLEARVRREAPLDVPEVLRIAEQIAVGLAAIHERNLIHRDIKPANIWLSSGSTQDTEPLDEEDEIRQAGPVKILDFGLVREVKGDTQLTEAGVVVGTPAYMSPEQVRGRALDARTDLFSFGCVLYVMCTGRRPFDADSPMAQAVALASDEPVRARALNRAVPGALSDLIDEMLGKDPEDRPDSANEVLERLRAIARGGEEREQHPAPRSAVRRYAIAFAALVWLVLAVLTTVALKRGAPSSDGKGMPPPQSTAEGVVYLSELPKLDEHVFPPPGAPAPPNVDGTVHVRGALSPHGIFMHGGPAFQPPSSARYALNKQFTRFAAEVAMNDTASKWTGLTFVVFADGKELWQSRNLSAGDPSDKCDLDVRHAATLTLEVRTAGPERGAHGAWIEPRLKK